ncbi:hypothetical protein J2I47_22970 [Fibrella sp. HMF5335]|uniref:Uncharacterized protein n=1 Tax=Fibrella rubiginis TaxID=2817060 RepID=A0A939K874_9BACT|nr:hypothetical protein [Fibrella rubiginis]MBO0939430.1 hypothetical protein [Fibrella rubiginis]
MKVNNLQDELACDSDSLLKLALCRRLAFGDSNFQQGIQQIAGYTGIDATKLASLLKRIAMQSSFSQVSKGSTLTLYSFVAAARERKAPTDSSQLSDDK